MFVHGLEQLVVEEVKFLRYALSRQLSVNQVDLENYSNTRAMTRAHADRTFIQDTADSGVLNVFISTNYLNSIEAELDHGDKCFFNGLRATVSSVTLTFIIIMIDVAINLLFDLPGCL